jgi:hypothetical protein
MLSDQGTGSNVWHIEVHTDKPGSVEVDIATETLRRHKSSRPNQILAKLIEGVSKILRQRFEKLLILFGIRRNCHSSGRGPNIMYVDESDCNNYCGISSLQTAYKTISSIHISMLTPYVEESTLDDPSWFLRNASTIGSVLCFR